jgi:outer membrane protein assembly factor BamA
MRNRIVFVMLVVILLGISQSFSQNSKQKDKVNDKKDSVDSLFNKESKTFVAIPIVNNNPTMKTGFGANAMFIFKLNKKDKLSPPSMVSVVGFYTTNKSYVVVPVAKLFWRENKNRVTIAVGSVGVHYDNTYETDTGDVTLVYKEINNFFWLEYSHKIIGKWYLGANYSGSKVNYKFNQGTDEENEFTEEYFEQKGITDDFISSLGVSLTYDSRNYIYYPTKGFQVLIRPRFYQNWLGSANNYTSTEIKLNGYFSLRSNMVLAAMVYGGFSSGDVPFNGYQSYGRRGNLRGYPSGKYRGKYMATAQAEFRWRFYKRLGAVLFAGSGSIWGNDDNDITFSNRNWLPGAGLGARFMISRVKKINLRLDYAIGVDGNMGLYFGMMESF